MSSIAILGHFFPRWLSFFADHVAAAVFRSFCPPFLGLFALRFFLHGSFSILSNWDVVHPEAKGWEKHQYRATFLFPAGCVCLLLLLLFF